MLLIGALPIPGTAGMESQGLLPSPREEVRLAHIRKFCVFFLHQKVLFYGSDLMEDPATTCPLTKMGRKSQKCYQDGREK